MYSTIRFDFPLKHFCRKKGREAKRSRSIEFFWRLQDEVDVVVVQWTHAIPTSTPIAMIVELKNGLPSKVRLVRQVFKIS